jgi:hypothetical protein
MANYVKGTNFTAKDSLPIGNAGKIVKGTEIDVELTAIADAIASKADSNSPTFTGTPLAPTAAAGTNNTQIATTAFVAAFSAVPSGVIVMWSGSIASIPSGWALCNGSNGTPDLRDRFVVGAGSSYAVAATGGSKDAIVVSHTHTATSVVTDPGHEHKYGSAQFNIASSTGTTLLRPAGSGAAQASTTETTGITVATTNASTGTSGTNANLPPYYALAYIQKT